MTEFKPIVEAPGPKKKDTWCGYDFSKPGFILYSRDGKGNGIIHEHVGGAFDYEMCEGAGLKEMGLFIGDTPGVFIFEGTIRHIGGGGGFFDESEPDINLEGEDREPTEEEWEQIHQGWNLWESSDWLTPEARTEMAAHDEIVDLIEKGVLWQRVQRNGKPVDNTEIVLIEEPRAVGARWWNHLGNFPSSSIEENLKCIPRAELERDFKPIVNAKCVTCEHPWTSHYLEDCNHFSCSCTKFVRAEEKQEENDGD